MAKEAKDDSGKWCAKITVHYCNKFFGEAFQCKTREEIQKQMKRALNEIEKKEQPFCKYED